MRIDAIRCCLLLGGDEVVHRWRCSTVDAGLVSLHFPWKLQQDSLLDILHAREAIAEGAPTAWGKELPGPRCHFGGTYRDSV